MGRRVELGFREGNLNLQDIQGSLKNIWNYQILLTSVREGWTRAGNLGEFSKIFQLKYVYSMVEEHFDFWVLQRM